MTFLRDALLLGTGASLATDLWALLRRRAFGIPPLNYALPGRWLLWLPNGRLLHRPISATPQLAGERLLGWTAHFVIGVLFAALFLALIGPNWLPDPRPLPALLFGLATALAPFCVMQPAFGAGVAGRHTPSPWRTRAHTLLTHAIFGMGLHATARLIS